MPLTLLFLARVTVEMFTTAEPTCSTRAEKSGKAARGAPAAGPGTAAAEAAATVAGAALEREIRDRSAWAATKASRPPAAKAATLREKRNGRGRKGILVMVLYPPKVGARQKTTENPPPCA